MSQSPPNNGPDWAVIGTALVTLAGVVSAVVAGMKGAFGHSNQQATAQEERRAAREKDATANAALTLESVFKLVNELQEEIGRKGTALVTYERYCADRVAALDAKIVSLEIKVANLDLELRKARGQ